MEKCPLNKYYLPKGLKKRRFSYKSRSLIHKITQGESAMKIEINVPDITNFIKGNVLTQYRPQVMVTNFVHLMNQLLVLCSGR